MWNWLAKAHELDVRGETFALVTVVATKGSTPAAAGAKMIVTASGECHGTVGGGQLEAQVIADARESLARALNAPHKYPLCSRTGQCCGGTAEVYIEIVALHPELYLFGAGHVGTALAQVLEGTAFRVHVVDQRRDWLDAPAMPASVVRHALDYRDFFARAPFSAERTFVAVMTPDHQLDLEIVHAALERPTRFLGLIGSATKWARFRQQLAAMGDGPERLARVHCPIGVAALGKSPREVAVSIAAQLLGEAHRDGG
jgi:xanthine dehydrogenase accessory factor